MELSDAMWEILMDRLEDLEERVRMLETELDNPEDIFDFDEEDDIDILD